MTPANYANFACAVMLALIVAYFIAPKRWR